MTTYMCPVCGYPDLDEPPASWEICPSCGTEFDYHDSRVSHAVLRQRWLEKGAPWHSRYVPAPPNWNAYEQIFLAFGERHGSTEAGKGSFRSKWPEWSAGWNLGELRAYA